MSSGILNADFAEDKAEQPCWPDEQELHVFKKRGFYSFDAVPDKLQYLGDNDDD